MNIMVFNLKFLFSSSLHTLPPSPRLFSAFGSRFPPSGTAGLYPPWTRVTLFQLVTPPGGEALTDHPLCQRALRPYGHAGA